MIEFHVDDGWQSVLLELGIETYDKMLAYRGEKCLSTHRRGATYRLDIPGQESEHLFLKCDYFTHKKEVVKDILFFRKPAQNSVKERRGFAWAKAEGITVPEVIAWGRTCEHGIPTQAAMVMREIHGISLQKHLQAGGELAMIDKAEQVLRHLYAAGYDWPDYKPEHFILMPDGNIALIDLERVTRPRIKLGKSQVEERVQEYHELCAMYIQ